MSEHSFYEERAKAEAKAAVVAVEAQTSAEIVVALRLASGPYRDADYLAGFVAALTALVAMLFVDRPFQLETFPLAVAVAFAAGAFLTSRLPPLRRLFLRQGRRSAAVRAAARAAFVDLGVSRTHRRSGILVYVSMLERLVEVVPDVGVDPGALGAEWKDAVAALSASLRPRPSLDRFLGALRALGPVLGRALPHHEGDANELPDDVQ
jgi:putative membrane protein